MTNKSLWSKYIKNNNKNEIDKFSKIDVLIIGGGLSGISTAFELKDSNLKVCLIESNKIGSGTTSLTTGKLTYLQDTIYTDLSKMHDIKLSEKYLKSQLYALKHVNNIIKNYNIDCDLIKNDSYIFCTNDNDIKKIDDEYNILKKFNVDAQIIHKLPIKFPCKYGLKVKDTYVFNPIKYINGLLKIIDNKVKIYENVRALEVSKDNDLYIVKTNKNTFKTKYVIVCTHYPFFILPGLIPFKTNIQKSHVVASKIKNIESFNAISVGKETYSIRYAKDKTSYIIFAGESYKMSNHINYEERQKELELKFKKYFNSDIDYSWSIHDITSNDLLPLVGKIDNNLLLATAFNKWGMLNSILSGKILRDIVLNEENEFINLFKLNRKITIKRTLNFLCDSINISKIFLKTKIDKNKSFYNDRVKIVSINGKSYGIYKDDDGKKHKIRNLCPHMKCSLIFNFMDKTWDCPCHGSRFDIDGNVIKGPSVFNIKIDDNNNKL